MMASSSMTSILITTPWLLCLKQNNQARLRLFCFPYAGGGAHIFRAWPDSLPADVEVCSIQLPGRGARLMETPFSQISLLVHALAHAFLPHLDKPFALFGHSMGALVGFELARQLRRQCGLEPVQLFVSGCFAPQIPDPHLIGVLPEAEFIEELRRLNGMPEEVLEHTELLQLMLPALRADCMLTETYTYMKQPPLNCPISVFGGLQDPLVGREHLEAWHEHTSASFSLRMLLGDHFFLHTSQPLLLEILARELRQLVSMSTSG